MFKTNKKQNLPYVPMSALKIFQAGGMPMDPQMVEGIDPGMEIGAEEELMENPFAEIAMMARQALETEDVEAMRRVCIALIETVEGGEEEMVDPMMEEAPMVEEEAMI